MPKLQFYLQTATSAEYLPTSRQLKHWASVSLNVDTEVTIRIVDEEEGQTLNRDYRGKDYATNVLTFALTEEPYVMGDIVLCAPVIAAEAHAQNKLLEAHYAHLTVHGILHLQGYDHISEAQAELMESLEISILAKLGYANPYLITQDAAHP